MATPAVLIVFDLMYVKGRLHAGEPDVESYRLALDVAEVAQTLSRGID